MLLYTCIKRTASYVARSYVFEDRRRQLRIMKDLVDESLSLLSGNGDIRSFGELLHEAWVAKRSLSPAVSNIAVDEIYEEARQAGALGGKLLGAGGGGFLLLFGPPEAQPEIKERLNRLICVPFRFEYAGSQIIFIDRQEDFSGAEKLRATRPLMHFQELSEYR